MIGLPPTRVVFAAFLLALTPGTARAGDVVWIERPALKTPDEASLGRPDDIAKNIARHLKELGVPAREFLQNHFDSLNKARANNDKLASTDSWAKDEKVPYVVRGTVEYRAMPRTSGPPAIEAQVSLRLHVVGANTPPIHIDSGKRWRAVPNDFPPWIARAARRIQEEIDKLDAARDPAKRPKEAPPRQIAIRCFKHLGEHHWYRWELPRQLTPLLGNHKRYVIATKADALYAQCAPGAGTTEEASDDPDYTIWGLVVLKAAETNGNKVIAVPVYIEDMMGAGDPLVTADGELGMQHLGKILKKLATDIGTQLPGRIR